MTQCRQPQASPGSGGCRRAAWVVAMALSALLGSLVGIALWAILSAALLLALVVGAVVASAGHGPGPKDFDFGSDWLGLFKGGAVYAVLAGAFGGAMFVGSLRSLLRWIRWRRELRPLLKADPTLRARVLLPLSCKIVFAIDLLLCLVHLFLVLCGFASGVLDHFPTLRMLVLVGLLASLLGVLGNILFLKGRSIAVLAGWLAVLATLASIAVHGAAVFAGPREPVHLTVLMFLVPVLRIAWLAVFVKAFFRFRGWVRLPKPEIPPIPAT